MATATVAVNIPGPRALPLLGWRGNLVQFGRDPIAYMRTARQYGEIVSMVRGRDDLVFTFSPDYTRQLLTDTDLFFSHPFVDAPPDTALRRLTIGLLSMNGSEHRQMRKLIMPAFHRKAVDRYRDDMAALTAQMLDGWQIGQQFDLAAAMQRLTLRIASKTLYGLDAAQDAERIGGLLKRWLRLHESPLTLLLPRDYPGTTFRRLLRVSEELEAVFLDIIAWKRRQSGEQNDVLTMLLHARDEEGNGLSDAELVGQASILLNAGHETTSNALTWTLFLLSQHPRVLADLREELRDVLGGSAPAVAQLGQLPLLDRVIKESMRVLPPVCFSFRYSTAPVQLGPYELKKGVGLFFSQYNTHHDPNLYPQPERFLPERWQTIDLSPYEYLPFGAGPRMCIGATFATMEMKIVLAMILQRFQLAVLPNTRIDRQITITLSPKHGMPVVVAPPDRVLAPALVRGNIHEMVEW